MAECFLSGSLSGEEKWLPMLGSSGGRGGRTEPVYGCGADDEGGAKLQHNPTQTSSVG